MTPRSKLRGNILIIFTPHVLFFTKGVGLGVKIGLENGVVSGVETGLGCLTSATGEGDKDGWVLFLPLPKIV